MSGEKEPVQPRRTGRLKSQTKWPQDVLNFRAVITSIGDTDQPSVVLNPDCTPGEIEHTISTDIFVKTAEALMKTWQSRTQRASRVEVAFAKDLYMYFVRDFGHDYLGQSLTGSGKDGVYKRKGGNKNPHVNPFSRDEDLALRRCIKLFLCKHFPSVHGGEFQKALTDIGKQKRKEAKQKAERRKGLNKCSKCGKKFRSQTHCAKHEPSCKKLEITRNFHGKKRPKRQRTETPPKKVSAERITAGHRFRGERGDLEKVANGIFPGLNVTFSKLKQACLTTTQVFQKGQLICTYDGELLRGKKAISKRHAKYDKIHEFGSDQVGTVSPVTLPGSYMLEYKFKEKLYCIDGTIPVGYGRYANHSKKAFNAKLETFEYTDAKGINRHIPVLRAARDIGKGEEILYDYGTRVKEDLTTSIFLKY